MKKHLMLAAVIVTFSAQVSHASLLSVSYTLSTGDTLAGLFEGVLQADNNTFVVNSVVDFATFNGVNGPSLPNVQSLAVATGLGTNLDPIVTLDGSFMDIIACPLAASCTDGFGFGVGSLNNLSGPGFYIGGASFGGIYSPDAEAFQAQTWTASQVPAPATVALFGLGLAGLSFSRRRAY